MRNGFVIVGLSLLVVVVLSLIGSLLQPESQKSIIALLESALGFGFVLVSITPAVALFFFVSYIVLSAIYQPAKLYQEKESRIKEVQSKLETGLPISVTERNENQRVSVTLKYPTRNQVTGLKVGLREDLVEQTDKDHPKVHPVNIADRQFLLPDNEIPRDQERHVALAEIGQNDQIEFCLNPKVSFNSFLNRDDDRGRRERYADVRVAIVVCGETGDVPTAKAKFTAILHYVQRMQEIDQANGKPYEKASSPIIQLERIQDDQETEQKAETAR